MFEKVRKGKYDKPPGNFKMVSAECKDLIDKLLVVDPGQRLCGIEALKHPWFSKFAENAEVEEEEDLLCCEVIERL